MSRLVSDLYFSDQVISASVTASTYTTVLSPPVDRKMFYVYNFSPASMFLKFGPGCSSEHFTLLMDPYSFYEFVKMPCYSGVITGLWTQQTGSAKVTQLL